MTRKQLWRFNMIYEHSRSIKVAIEQYVESIPYN